MFHKIKQWFGLESIAPEPKQYNLLDYSFDIDYVDLNEHILDNIVNVKVHRNMDIGRLKIYTLGELYTESTWHTNQSRTYAFCYHIPLIEKHSIVLSIYSVKSKRMVSMYLHKANKFDAKVNSHFVFKMLNILFHLDNIVLSDVKLDTRVKVDSLLTKIQIECIKNTKHKTC